MKKQSLQLLILILVLLSFMGFSKRGSYSNKYFSIKNVEDFDVIQFSSGEWYFNTKRDENLNFTIRLLAGLNDEDDLMRVIKQHQNGVKAYFDPNDIKISEGITKAKNKYHLLDIEDESGQYLAYYIFNGKYAATIDISFDRDNERKIELKKIVDSIKFSKSEFALEKIEVKEWFTKREAVRSAKDLMKKLSIHKGLYLYRDKEQTEAEFEEMLETIKTKAYWKRHKLFVYFAKFVAGIKESHTSMGDPLAFDHYFENYFPFPIVIKDRKIYFDDFVYVKGAPSKKEIVGKEIVSITDIPSEEIIQQMLEMIPTEIDSENSSYKIMEEAFSYYLQYVIGTHVLNNRIVYRDGEEEKLIQVPASKEMVFGRRRWITLPRVYSLNEETALMDIPTFHLDLRPFAANLERNFNDLKEKETKNLVIDLRANTGGYLSNWEELYSYIDKTDPNYSFQGDVYVLSGAKSFSASIEFLEQVRIGDNNAVIVGEKPGGTTSIFGSPRSASLIETYFVLSVATKSYKEDPEKYEIIKPDYEVKSDDDESYMNIVMKLIEDRN